MTRLLIVGAGPAGMSAALEASAQGTCPLVVDNRPEPGGNVYAWAARNAAANAALLRRLGKDYVAGGALVREFLDAAAAGRVRFRASSSLWRLDRDGHFAVSDAQGTRTGQAEAVILATGAQERPLPVPGWTLPGVMGVGAAQLLIKAGGRLPEGGIVIVGAGPLPLLVAGQLHALGHAVAAGVEPAGASRLLTAPASWPGALAAPGTALKGLGLLLRRLAARRPVHRGARQIAILGTQEATGIRFVVAGTERRIAARTVLLHDGVVPNLNPLAGSGLPLRFAPDQQTWHAAPAGRLHVAGDAGGILGAQAATLSGRKAALTALGKPVPAPIARALKRQAAFRRFLDGVYPPVQIARGAPDETVICRCEAVTAGEIRAEAAAAGGDPNRLKRALRTGMGPCQGRMCSHAIASVLAQDLGRSEGEIGYGRVRSPFLPVSFDALARSQEA